MMHFQCSREVGYWASWKNKLRLLRKSRAVPAISAFTPMYSVHNYDAHSRAIMGQQVQIHVMPRKRKSWESNTKNGHYLGVVWDHYRCHRVCVAETKSERIDLFLKLICQIWGPTRYALLSATTLLARPLKQILLPMWAFLRMLLKCLGLITELPLGANIRRF